VRSTCSSSRPGGGHRGCSSCWGSSPGFMRSASGFLSVGGSRGAGWHYRAGPCFRYCSCRACRSGGFCWATAVVMHGLLFVLGVAHSAYVLHGRVKVVWPLAAMGCADGAIDVNRAARRHHGVWDRFLSQHVVVAVQQLYRAVHGNGGVALVLQWYGVTNAAVGEHATMERQNGELTTASVRGTRHTGHGGASGRNCPGPCFRDHSPRARRRACSRCRDHGHRTRRSAGICGYVSPGGLVCAGGLRRVGWRHCAHGGRGTRRCGHVSTGSLTRMSGLRRVSWRHCGAYGSRRLSARSYVGTGWDCCADRCRGRGPLVVVRF